MTLALNLGESQKWEAHTEAWPSWADRVWLREHDAILICELSRPEDLSFMRAMVPDPERLLAYPDYPNLLQELSAGEREKIDNAFLQILGAHSYLNLEIGASKPSESDFIGVHRVNEGTGNEQKKRLALVAPMPPSVAGISNYCMEIVPHFEAFYDITLVVEDPASAIADLHARYKLVSHAQFLANGDDYHRVMYHFGNSHFHYDYFTLLKARPGVVVLHDIYAGDGIFSNFENMGKTQLLQYIYLSHGWNAVADCGGPVRKVISLYPACGSLFTDSYGLIAHNKYANELLSLFFSQELLQKLAHAELARQIRPLPEKTLARQRLGVSDDTILFCSFGQINNNKCIRELLQAWHISGLADDASAVLCLAGGCSDHVLENELNAQMALLPNPDQAFVTGFLDNANYDLYLAAADVAVQLRKNSRGETSVALLDCMAAGLSVIINAHGSMDEFPDSCVIKVPDEFTPAELGEALLEGHRCDDSLGDNAQNYIEANHNPVDVAAKYAQHMESFYQTSTERISNQVYNEIFYQKLDSLAAHDLWSCTSEYEDLMFCASRGKRPPDGAQLLIDISALVEHDLKSGIQRVVRNILRKILLHRSLGYRAEAVYYDFDAKQFRYARSFVNQFLNFPALCLSDDPVEAQSGDIYLGLDLCYFVAGRQEPRNCLHIWRGRGVKIYNVIYDLLPIILSDCFPPYDIPNYRDWLKGISTVSDGVICISRSTADDYRTWLNEEGSDSPNVPSIGYFHLGAEMEGSADYSTSDVTEKRLLARFESQPFLLMVGTIEPRKGHQQVLEAFDVLWENGNNLQLVIVGSVGWIDDEFSSYLQRLSDRSNKLHHLDFVSEGMLGALYKAAAGTIMASKGEGFGLPVIEAAYHGSPLIARDLAVFREICGDNVWYFNSTSGVGLANELEQWLALWRDGRMPLPGGITWLNWEQSTGQLLANIVDQDWYIANETQ